MLHLSSYIDIGKLQIQKISDYTTADFVSRHRLLELPRTEH
mgnify:CR=1 FL=1